ncbi:MAG: choice-of-anchor Q domain-containing protein [bacterium]
MRRLRFLATTLLSIALAAACGCSGPLTVDRFDDDPTATACLADVPDDCSLRGAILNANRTLGPGVIDVPAGDYLLVAAGRDEDEGLTGDLDITDAVEIYGRLAPSGFPAVRIDAQSADRVIHVHPLVLGSAVRVQAIELREGDTGWRFGDPPTSTADGGLVLNDGAALTLDQCRLRIGLARYGGLVASRGILAITASTLDGGEAVLGGGGLVNGDPEVPGSGGSVALARTTVTRNDISYFHTPSPFGGGGGVLNAAGGAMLIQDSTVSENTYTLHDSGGPAFTGGGGIRNLAQLDISGSLFELNETDGDSTPRGGAILNDGALQIRNTTFHQNGCCSGSLGDAAVFNTGIASLDHVTFAFDVAAVWVESGHVESANSLFRSSSTFPGPPACAGGELISLGGNLEAPSNTCGLHEPTDQVGVADPGLATIASNGGPTKTIALLATSPAIDGGIPGACLATDQRGEPRDDGHCDIGAFERQASDP